MRLKPSMMPKVHMSHKDKGYGFIDLATRYEDMDKQPLIVTAKLATPYIPSASDHSVHLDGILSQAVLTAHPCAPLFDKEVCIVPLPIEIAWLSQRSLPLWAASDMLPDTIVQAREYWHKRYPSHRADFGTKLSATTTAGRWKEYRVPVSAIRTDTLQAVAIGNRDEVLRLLGYVSHIGKKGTAGYGRVASWAADPINLADPMGVVLSAKAIPVECAQAANISGKYNPLRGWTPPYWYAPYHAPCIVTSCQP